jgi:Alkylmercury lyase
MRTLDPMAIETEPLRLAVYRALAESGRAPDHATLAATLGTSTDEVRAGLRRLHEQRHLVLDADDRVVLAHPFGTIDFGFSVKGARTLWWGGCVWDSFAIPNLVPEEPSVLVATTCPACGKAHAWTVTSDGPPGGSQVAHFLVPTRRIWDDVLFSCANQRVFCDERCVDAWVAREGQERGYVADLATVWRLARGWYAGRLDEGYRRREPAEATAYFREVGLRGPFWGLPEQEPG